MAETGFWWSHYGHLCTKPLVAAPIWFVTQLVVPGWIAVAIALAIPAAYSLWRKNKLWPGCLSRETKVVAKDEVADTWAAAVAVLPLAADMPWPYKIALAILMIFVLWPLGLHRWALP